MGARSLRARCQFARLVLAWRHSKLWIEAVKQDMHSKDRYWPLIVCVDFLLLVVFPVILGAGSALGILSLWETIAQVEWASLDTWGQLFGLLPIACGFGFFAWYAFQARRRELFRKRALAGDKRTMVVATTVNNQLGAKALTEEPLALRWNKGYIVSATINGLLWQRPKKRDVLVAWSDARLLKRWECKWAHQDKTDIFEYGYRLYIDSRKFIEWTDAPERQLSGESDISWEQKDALQSQLLAIITARTNLPVRFIESSSGTQKKRGKRRRFGWVALVNLALFLLFAGVPLTTGVLALTAPFTRNLALNLVVATLYGGVGLLLLVLIAHAVIAVGRPDEPTLPPPTAELPLVPLATLKSSHVALRATIPSKQRVVSLILFIVCLLGATCLEILSYQDFPISDTAHPRLSDAHQVIQALFFTCTFIVLILLGVGAFSRAEVLHADDTVLHWGKRKKRQSILWADVAILAAQVSAKGRLESFRITEAPPQSRTIGWPANARWVQTPEGASSDDVGAQFAAIVAQRAGVQPTTEWA